MALTLEAFDGSAPATSPQRREPSPEFLAGFSAGEDAAQAAIAQDHRVLSASLVQSVADAAFGYEEALSHIISNLAPLFDATLTKLLPATLPVGLKAALLEILKDAVESDARLPVEMLIHPDQVAAVEAALAELDHPHLKILGQADIGPHAALVTTHSGETLLDLDAALAEISGIFDALPQSQARSS